MLSALLRRELMVRPVLWRQVVVLSSSFAPSPGWERARWLARVLCGARFFGSWSPVGSRGGPSLCWRPAQSEGGQAGQVVSGGEEAEVGVDFPGAAYSGAAPAVFAAHEMSEFAFDLGRVAR